MLKRNREKCCTCDFPVIHHGSSDVYCAKCGCNPPMPEFKMGHMSSSKPIVWESELERFYRLHGKFVKEAFPEITDFRGPLKHLLKEVQEAIESGDEEEFADIFMLLLSAFRLRFPRKTINFLILISIEKLGRNKMRKWEMNDEGFAEHVR